jgi:transcriptional regulator with XRE-family HTH domain
MSGDGEEYTDDEINDVYDAVSDAWEDYTGGGGSSGGGGAVGGGGGGSGPSGGSGGGGPIGGGAAPGGGGLGAITVTGNGSANGQITVTAKIEWAGEYANNGHGGERTVRLDRVDTRPIVAALRKARTLELAALRGPLRSYNAKSAQAQLNQLNTKRGQEALREAGFSPSRRTLRRWEQGTQKPSKANREKIAEAYENVRNPGRGVMGARRAVTDALTQSLRDRYDGQNIRFRDIRTMRIH